MTTHQKLLFVLLVISQCASFPSCHAQFATTESPDGSLIRLRDREVGLQRLSQGALSGAGYQLLESVLSHPIDIPMERGPQSSWTGQRAFAIELLRRADPDIQRQWQTVQSAAASAALRDALLTRDPAAVLQVARRYPMTREGLRAESVLLTWLLLQGQVTTVATATAELRTQYERTVLAAEATKLADALDRRLHQLPELPPIPASTGVSAPWSRPDWTWRETAWMPVLEHRLQAAQLLGLCRTDRPLRIAQLQAYPVGKWSDWLMVRTPFRLVALDAATGKEQWSLLERSLNPSQYDEEGSPGNQNANTLRKFGLACDPGRLEFTAVDNELWIIGGANMLQVGDDRVSDLQDPLFRFRRFAENSGTAPETPRNCSLIALRKDAAASVPQIAWIAGNAQAWPAQIYPGEITGRLSPGITATGDPGPDAESRDDSLTHSLLDDHQFLCAPAVLDQRVYVLTENSEICFLNCLQRGNGRVLWQQPVEYRSDSVPIRGIASGIGRSAGYCLANSDRVICRFPSGVLTSSDPVTGQLQWLQTFSVPEDETEKSEDVLSAASGLLQKQGSFRPVHAADFIYARSPIRDAVVCLHAESGEMRWAVPASSLSMDGGNPQTDRSILRADQHQLVLAGTHHVRCLDVADGRELWRVETEEIQGRAVIDQDRCLIPICGRKPVTVDLKTGYRVGWGTAAAVQTPVSFGSLTTDDEHVFESSIGVVTAFQRADRFAAQDNSNQQRVSALLLNGSIAAAEAVSIGKEENVAAVDEQILNSLLDVCGEILAQRSRPETATKIATLFEKFRKPSPGGEQCERAYLMGKLLEAPDLGDAFFEFSSRPVVDQKAVPVSSRWSVSRGLVPAEEELQRWMEISEELSVAEARRLAMTIGRFPRAFTIDQVRHFAQLLRTRGMIAAEEFTLSAILDRQIAPPERSQILNRLHEIRGTVPPDGEDSTIPSTDGSWKATASYVLTGENLKTDQEELTVFVFASEDANQEELTVASPAARYGVGLPSWYDGRLRIRRGQSQSLETVNSSGSEICSRVPNDQGWSRFAGVLAHYDRSFSTPGLLPVAADGRLVMVRLQKHRQLEILWQRNLTTDQSSMDELNLEMGPMTHAGLIWFGGGQLHCTDLLSGNDLWTRVIALDGAAGNGLLPLTMPRLFGDRHVAVTIWQESGAWAAWDPLTGKLLRTGTITAGRGTNVKVQGRFLAYTDLLYNLHVLDPLTGEDLAAGAEAIRISAYQIGELAATTGDGQIIFVDESGKLVLMNSASHRFQTGDTLVLPQSEQLHGIAGIAMQNHTLLLVQTSLNGLDTQSGTQQNNVATISGLIAMMENATGKLLWSRMVEDVAVPVMEGDKSDLLPLITLPPKGAEGANTNLIRVTVLHRLTGQELLETESFPLQYAGQSAHYDSSLRRLTIDTVGGTLSIEPRR